MHAYPDQFILVLIFIFDMNLDEQMYEYHHAGPLNHPQASRARHRTHLCNHPFIVWTSAIAGKSVTADRSFFFAN